MGSPLARIGSPFRIRNRQRVACAGNDGLYSRRFQAQVVALARREKGCLRTVRAWEPWQLEQEIRKLRRVKTRSWYKSKEKSINAKVYAIGYGRAVTCEQKLLVTVVCEWCSTIRCHKILRYQVSKMIYVLHRRCSVRTQRKNLVHHAMEREKGRQLGL